MEGLKWMTPGAQWHVFDMIALAKGMKVPEDVSDETLKRSKRNKCKVDLQRVDFLNTCFL
ncbi:MAG: hypothetical protein LUH20_10425 [Lachnospiraceae bacterium]|nr:hypothetical protein [Lachnospiraceae bacterium]